MVYYLTEFTFQLLVTSKDTTIQETSKKVIWIKS